MKRWIAFLVALLLPIGAFLPLLPSFGSSLVGFETVDHYGTQWFYMFAERQVLAGESLLWTDLFFYPWGKEIYAHTGANLLDALLAVPLRLLLGATLGYNVFILLGVSATAAAFYTFARDFVDESSAVAGAGLLALCPYVLYELVDGRPTQAILIFPILFLHQLWRAGLPQAPPRTPWLAGLFLALSAYQYWFYGLFGGLVAIAVAAGRLWEAPSSAQVGPSPLRIRVSGLFPYCKIAACSLVLCAPGALPLLLALGGPDTPVGLLSTSSWTATHMPLVTVEGKEVGLGVWQLHVAGIWKQKADGTELFLATLWPFPLSILLATLYWLRAPGRLSRPPLLLALGLLIVVGAGPTLLVVDWLVPNPIYLTLTYFLDFFRRLWWPVRVLAFGSPLLYLVLAVALDQVRTRSGKRAWGVALLIAAGLQWFTLAGVQLLPIPAWKATIPAGYRCLAEGPPGALIALPWAWSQAHLYYQTVHQRPMLGGMVEDDPDFAPKELAELRARNTLIRRLDALANLGGPVGAAPADTAGDVDLAVLPEHVEELGRLGYRYVVLQKDAYLRPGTPSRGEQLAQDTAMRRLYRAFEAVLGRPVYQDARLQVWAPWGGDRPCAAAEGDQKPVQRMDLDPVTRAGTDRERAAVYWLW